MGSFSTIGIMIAVCTAFVVVIVMAKPLQFLLSLLVNACVGVAGIVITNFVLAPFSFAIGVNFLTAGFVAILGLPGFVALVVIQALL